MYPTSFEQSNAVVDTPSGIDPLELPPRAVCTIETNVGVPGIISCFKLTKEELEEISRTGRVWVTTLGLIGVPVILNGKNPFDNLEMNPGG